MIVIQVTNFLQKQQIDIRDLISLDDAVDAMKLGPNGGLVFCIEYLRENMEWLEDELSQFDEDGYFVFDCPGTIKVHWFNHSGQIELFTHFSFLGDITTRLTEFGFRLISVYLVCHDILLLRTRWIVLLFQMNPNIFRVV